MLLYCHFYNTLSLTASHVSRISHAPPFVQPWDMQKVLSQPVCPDFLLYTMWGRERARSCPSMGLDQEALSGAADCFFWFGKH